MGPIIWMSSSMIAKMHMKVNIPMVSLPIVENNTETYSVVVRLDHFKRTDEYT